MNRKLINVIIACICTLVVNAQELSLKKGMVIKKTIKIKKGTYNIDAFDSLDKAVIVIEGNNIIVDFNRAILRGSAGKTKPDQFFGTAVMIRKGKNITIRNLVARGYKIALFASGIEGLIIENCDFSYNYRPSLNSFEEKLLPGWSYYHANENDQWMQHGAAMYLKYSDNLLVKNCKVTGGQNALMLTACNDGQFYNNDFSFNSGFGIGMYRCSNNKVLYNKLDFNVRNYGPGAVKGMQNSAGILVYDKSNDNMFYKNSATHCGQGFLLLTGTRTSNTYYETSRGNRIWSNDFSYAAGNGIDITSSSSHIYDNRFFECEAGIRGEYCIYTTIANNKFRNNSVGIVLERGQHNRIESNILFRDQEAIRLSGQQVKQSFQTDSIESSSAKSIDYIIHLNSFNQHPLVYNFTRTDSLRIYNNRYSFTDEIFRIDSSVTNIDSLPLESIDTTLSFPYVKGPMDPFKGRGKLAGRDKIMITEWGPYDFRYPIVWNSNPTDSSGQLKFEVLGPKGKWKLVSVRGIELAGKKTDTLPSEFTASLLPGVLNDFEIILEFSGQSFTDPFGNKIPANKPYRFVFRKQPDLPD